MRKLSLFILMMLLPMLASADNVEINGIYYYLDAETKQAAVMPGNWDFWEGSVDDGRYSGEIIIPESVKYEDVNYSVTYISLAFYNCKGLTSVTIPNSVTTIGNDAFHGCTGLTSVTIPNSVTSIGNGAFERCTGLTSVTIPSGEIGKNAFEDCEGLTSVIVGDGVTYIGKNAFADCSNLASIVIGRGVSSIEGADVFYGCTSLISIDVAEENIYYTSVDDVLFTKDMTTLVYYPLAKNATSYSIPNGVTSIGKRAFGNCNSLTSVTFANSIISIGDYAFFECSGLTSVIIPDNVTTIGEFAFYGTPWNDNLPDGLIYLGKVLYRYNGKINNTGIEIEKGTVSICPRAFYCQSGLTSVTIPNSVTTIGGMAFSNCTGLTSVTIPNGVTTIGEEAFAYCTELTTVTFPNSIISIGSGAFKQTKLTDVYCYAEKVPKITLDVIYSYYTLNVATLHVPAGTIELYQAAEGWKMFKYIVEIDLEPVEKDETVDYGEGGDITEETNLTGTIVNNMYYNIGTDAGGYSAEDGCIIIAKETSDEQMAALEGLGISDEELKQNFTGIIFKVPAGSAKVTVTAETKGNMTLKVKVGKNETMEMGLSGKLKMEVPYNVSEESLVYIFAGTTDENASRGVQNAPEEKSLKIYGIEWEQTVKGDINGDGTVDAKDIVELVNYILGKLDEKAVDVNGDGVVNIADIVKIINIIMGGK